MRIGFLTAEYPTVAAHFGGIGTMTQTVARAAVVEGHAVRVYALTPKTLEPHTDEGVEVLPVPRAKSAVATTRVMRRRLLEDLAHEQLDILEAPECESHLLPKADSTVVRLHGGHHFFSRELGFRRRPGRLLLEQLGVRRAAALVAVSHYVAERTRKSMHLGDRPIEVIPNPVDLQRFNPRPESVVAGRIVFVGTIVQKKGIFELTDAMPAILEAYPEAELIVVGRDWKGPEGQTSSRRLIQDRMSPETASRVQFLGAVSHDRVAELMASAQVVALPSHMESQGIVFAEAMACGRPVVGPKTGPGPEVLGTDEACGLLVDPRSPESIAEAVGALLNNPDRCNSMGFRGRRRAEACFDLSTILQQNLEFWRRSAVNGPRVGGLR